MPLLTENVMIEETTDWLHPFVETIKFPTDFEAWLGHHVRAFSYLESAISNAIAFLLGIDSQNGYAITAESSSRNLIGAFASVVKIGLERKQWKTASDDIELRLSALIVRAHQCEEKRNQNIHSSYVQRKFQRKVTAKSKHGVRERITEISIDS